MSALNATAMLYHTLFTTLMQINHTSFPDGDGVLYRIQLPDDPQILKSISASEVDVNAIVFTLYTQENRNGQIISIDDPNSVSESNFKSHRQTVVITHGFNEVGPLKSCNRIRDAFADRMNYNVIIVDWTRIANNAPYPIVAESVPKMADHVAKFVNFMRLHTTLNTEQLKMVGFSIGAHIVSLAARVLKQSNSPVAEVIALDPVSSMFEDKGPDGRVDRSHAVHVQVIHTNAGQLGMYRVVGTSDFYANGGTVQPGCLADFSDKDRICAHERSYEYYSESIANQNGFPGKSLVGIPIEANMGGIDLDPRAKGYMFNFLTRGTRSFVTVPLYMQGG